MDKGIKKDINLYNNNLNNGENKIEFKEKKMVNIDGNKNGMTINNIIEEEIKKKENEIKNMEDILKKKYEEGQKKSNEFKIKFIKTIDQAKYKYNIELGKNDK